MAMRSIVLLLLVIGVGAALSGCLSCPECGTLQRQNDISSMFWNYEVVPGYDYYYSGPEDRPSAVMAMDPSYTIQSSFWKPINLEGDELSKWMEDRFAWKQSSRMRYNGAEILDPNGKRAGIFFSKFDDLVTKFQGDKVIEVYPPSYRAGSGRSTKDSDR